MEISTVDTQIDSLKSEISDQEALTMKNNELSLDNVTSWLAESGIKDESSPQYYYDRLIDFDKQLRSDHATLIHHANESKFSHDSYRSSNGSHNENGHMFQFVPAPPMT